MSTRLLWIACLSLLVASASLWISLNGAEDRLPTREELAEQIARLEAEVATLHAALDRVEKAQVRPPLATVPRRDPESDLAMAAAGEAVPELPSGAAREEESPVAALVESFPDLGRRERERAIEAVVDAARDGDAAALELILAGLADEDPRVREESVQALGELGDPAQFDRLAGLVGDESRRVREEVAESMASMPAGQAGPVLARMLGDRDDDVVEEALDSLGRLEYRAAIPRILEVARGDDLEMAARAAGTLRRMGETGAMRETLDRVARGLQSSDALDRVHTVNYLRRVGGPEATAYLRDVAQRDASLSVREAARDALERLSR